MVRYLGDAIKQIPFGNDRKKSTRYGLKRSGQRQRETM
jgi:hypothetical protein